MANFYILLICIFGFSLSAFPQLPTPVDREVNIEINADPFQTFEIGNPSQQRFGSLEFRGGMVLTSSHKLFGGISALRVQKDGEHFVALSDRGTWLQGRIVYKDDRPVRIADASLAPVLDADGNPAPRWDTESIAENGSTLYVGLERLNSIVSFDYGKEGIRAPGRPVAVPPEAKDLPFNQGFESMVFVDKKLPLGGTLIAISEQGLTESGDIKAFLIGGPTPGMFAVKRTNQYAIGDAAILPGGDILILERQYSQERGVLMRIRRIRLADIKPGAVVDGPTVIEADKRHQIDNMEALSIHQDRGGELVLSIMSDNNHSERQRTLLLQFTLREK